MKVPKFIKYSLAVVALSILLNSPSPLNAATKIIHYQGRLRDTGGVLINTNRDFKITISTSSSEKCYQNVPVQSGIFELDINPADFTNANFDTAGMTMSIIVANANSNCLSGVDVLGTETIGASPVAVTSSYLSGAPVGTYNVLGNMYVNGNTGLGTTSIDNRLEVNGTLELQYDDQDSRLRFHDPSNAWYSMGIDVSDGRKFKLNYGGNVGDNAHFTMTTSGNVGIGASNPWAKLQVDGGTSTLGGRMAIYGNTSDSATGTNTEIDLYDTYTGDGWGLANDGRNNNGSPELLFWHYDASAASWTNPLGITGDNRVRFGSFGENSDNITLYRISGGADISDLRLDIGDNVDLNDRLVFGSTYYGDGTFYVGSSISSNGTIELGDAGTYNSLRSNQERAVRFTSKGANGTSPDLLHPAGIIYGGYIGSGGWGGQALVLRAANDWSSYVASQLVLLGNGNVGIGLNDPDSKLEVLGNIHATAYTCGATDIAERIPVEEPLQAGDVVVTSTENAGAVMKSIKAYDASVIGIVSSNPAIILGETEKGEANEVTIDGLPIALAGRVPVCVVNENGSIQSGDLLVTSSTPGCLMKSSPEKIGAGMLVAKAMDSFSSDKGSIVVFVK